MYPALVNMHLAFAFPIIFNKFNDISDFFSPNFEKLIKTSGGMGWRASNDKSNLFEQSK